MDSTAGFFFQSVMSRSLLGAHAQDRVVPDRAGRQAADPQGPTLSAHATLAEPARRIGPRDPASADDAADRRRAA